MGIQSELTCKNCKANFQIEPEDFAFYERIAVPPPTFCPECRLKRRLTWRNERTLYKRPCDLCKTDTFAMYPADSVFPVYCSTCWWGDGWDSTAFGQDYDPTKSFFEQLHELSQKVPKIASYQFNTTNAPYANVTGNSKNIYLSYSLVKSEDVYYSRAVDESFRVFDCAHVGWLQNSYGDVYCGRSSNLDFSFRSDDCVDSKFLFDCANCQNCFMSSNLRNKRYVIRNQQYSKEEYKKKLAEEFDTGSYKKLRELQTEFNEMVLHAIHRFADFVNAVATTGDTVANTKHARDVFEGYNLEDVRYVVRALFIKDSYDTSFTTRAELMYEYMTGGENNAELFFTNGAFENLRASQYTEGCGSSSNLFGCIGLRGKQYCILNKQYSPQEYKTLVGKIKVQMTNDKEYGEYFPSTYSPFAYNESVVQEYFPLSKEEAIAKGYRWKDSELKHHQTTKTGAQLPDHINDVDDTICKEVIACDHGQTCLPQCTGAFKIISTELALYRQHLIALPRLCPNCRHYERIKMKNPHKLWHRKCMNPVRSDTSNGMNQGCANEFETSYAPDRPETIYCETCYQKEVL